MIKIIKGVYGYRINGRVEAKNSKSAPFKCDPKEEERLVKAGVAEYVEDTEKVITPAENAKKVTEKKSTAKKTVEKTETEQAPTFGAESTVVE